MKILNTLIKNVFMEDPKIKKPRRLSAKNKKNHASEEDVSATMVVDDEENHDYDGDDLELKCIHTIRSLSIDQVQASNNGHPGAPMGCAPMAHLLWNEVMSYSPSTPTWWNRDRFVLSNGHASALQYTMLHLTGYPSVTMDELKNFRKLGSKTPGHPESFVTEGVEVCTGPLGQGISNAVGLAMAERHLAATFNKKDGKFGNLFDHYTYVICGDGCLQEGVSSEASSLAGHLGLGKLIVLYDDNNITIDGSTDLSFTEDVSKRYDAYGWQTLVVKKNISNGLNELRNAIQQAQRETSKPTLISIKTTIGYGSSLEGSSKIHGSPLKADDLSNTKRKYGLDPEKSFYVDEAVRAAYEKSTMTNEKKKIAWDALYEDYKKTYPKEAAEIERRFSKKLPKGILDKLPFYEYGTTEGKATRKTSFECLNAIAPALPELIGGSADLTGSNLTSFGGIDFQKSTPEGRYIRYGVREHGMVAISNGLYAHGSGLRPFCATFLVFSGYAMGAIRLSALSQFPILYIMTHDSIGVGEDGPTHQPIETLENLRSMPNLNVIRPADGNETAAAYHLALTSSKTPTVICCSRTTLPALEYSSKEEALKGAYVCWSSSSKSNNNNNDDESPELILVATGSEVSICIEAASKLSFRTRVVSMPCQEVFLQQSLTYQELILPGNVPTLSVEASTIHGWHRFAHAHISMNNEFGKSGKGTDVMKYFGFTTENVVDKSKKVLEFYKNTTVPHLRNRPVL